MGTTQLESVPEPKYWHLKTVIGEALDSDFSVGEILPNEHDLAARGHRVIAVACGPAEAADEGRVADERRLRYLGLIAFADPLRPDVGPALEECRLAGIRVIVITGDHPATAAAVARTLGIATTADQVRTGHALDHATLQVEPEDHTGCDEVGW